MACIENTHIVYIFYLLLLEKSLQRHTAFYPFARVREAMGERETAAWLGYDDILWGKFGFIYTRWITTRKRTRLTLMSFPRPWIAVRLWLHTKISFHLCHSSKQGAGRSVLSYWTDSFPWWAKRNIASIKVSLELLWLFTWYCRSSSAEIYKICRLSIYWWLRQDEFRLGRRWELLPLLFYPLLLIEK